MTRFLFVHLLAGLLFAAGYWARDEYEKHDLWESRLALPAPDLGTLPPDTAGEESQNTAIVFDDIAPRYGVDFLHYDGAQGQCHIFEANGGGAAVLDFNNDGLEDLYLVTGARVPVDPNDRSHTARLYANNDAGFEDVTAAAGAGLVGYGQGVAAGDYDNDGFGDLFVACLSRSALYHNNGDGTFREVTNQAHASIDRFGTSTAFSDLDADGCLDLYVCTYVVVPLAEPLLCEFRGHPVHCEPQQYKSQPDALFHNQGEGTFADATQRAGIRDDHGRGLGVAIADFNGDHRPDIFVSNDTTANLLFVNQGGLTFKESALELGVALNGGGSTMSGMGIACGDYDGNGWLDLFVADFYESKNVLFANLGPEGFLDRADLAGVGACSLDRLTFGCVFLDADLDGHPDLFLANGHVDDKSAFGVPFKMRPQLFRNGGNGRFEDLSDSVGPYFHRELLGRGVAVADVNNDGLPDLLVNHINDQASLLLNRTAEHGHWLGLELIGRRSKPRCAQRPG